MRSIVNTRGMGKWARFNELLLNTLHIRVVDAAASCCCVPNRLVLRPQKTAKCAGWFVCKLPNFFQEKTPSFHSVVAWYDQATGPIPERVHGSSPSTSMRGCPQEMKSGERIRSLIYGHDAEHALHPCCAWGSAKTSQGHESEIFIASLLVSSDTSPKCSGNDHSRGKPNHRTYQCQSKNTRLCSVLHGGMFCRVRYPSQILQKCPVPV